MMKYLLFSDVRRAISRRGR